MGMMNCFGDKVSCKSLHCKIVLLDEQQLVHEVHVSTTGQDLLNVVFRHLNLVETAYFGLRYVDSAHQPQWLDPDKKVLHQLKGGGPHTLYFAVKFYAVDPCQLVEELTRYQFFLQIKQDVLQGRLPVSTDLAAELAALAIQSELGDYDPHRHKAGYVSEFRFLAHQSSDLETKIGELHKTLRGLVPAVAEMRYLDRVKWLDLYGVDLHPVLGEDTVEYFLGLTPSGIIVLRNKTKVGNYFWPRISKVSMKARYFMLRVRDKNNDENTFGFETPSKLACKSLHKCCLQHLTFFRLVQTSGPPLGRDQSGRHLPPGASFKLPLPATIGRGGGVAAGADPASRSPPQFRRLPSRRHQRRIDGAPSDAPSTQQQDDCNTSDSDKTVDVASTANILSPYHPTSVGGDGAESAPSNRSHRSGRSRSHSRSRKERRSSSVESRASNESKSHRRHRHRSRSRHNSDNESEVSRVSESSRGSRRRRRHRSRDSSGSESDHHSTHSHRSRRHRRRDSQGSTYELVDSQVQWKEIQERHGLVVSTASATASTAVQQATVRKALSSAATPSGGQQVNHSPADSLSTIETNSETSSRQRQHRKHHHRHHKHRSHSATPDKSEPQHGNSGKRGMLPAEIVPHLHFDLVDQPIGSNADQLREIPYQVVSVGQQQGAGVKRPPVGAPAAKDPAVGASQGINATATGSDGSVRHRHRIYQSSGLPYPEERKIISVDNDSPPPPYSPPTSSTAAECSNLTQGIASVNLVADPPAPERPTGLKPTANLVRAPPLPGPKPTKLRQANGFGHFDMHHRPQQQQAPQQQQQQPLQQQHQTTQSAYHHQAAHLATSGPIHSPVQAGGGAIGGVHYPPQYNHPPLSSSSPVGPSPHQIGLPLINGFTTSLPRVSTSQNPHTVEAPPSAKHRPPPAVSPLAAGINSVKSHDSSTLTRGQKFVTRPQTPVKPQAPPPAANGPPAPPDGVRRIPIRPPTLTTADDSHVTSAWHASLPRRSAPVQQQLRTTQRTQLAPHLQQQNEPMAAVATLPRQPRPPRPPVTTPMTTPMTTTNETRHRRASSLEMILSPMVESTLPRRSRKNAT